MFALWQMHIELQSMKNTTDKNLSLRLQLPDLLKGVAVLLMIQVHLVELFAKPEIFESALGRWSLFLGGPPAAPVFMAVMGYFLAKGNKSFIQLIYRGFKLLIWGFLLNIGLNANLFYHIFMDKVQANPMHYLFGVDILFLAGLSVITVAVFRLFFADKVFYWAVLMLIAAAIFPYMPAVNPKNSLLNYFLAYLYLPVSWSYFPLFPWLSYVLAGYIFYLLKTGHFYLDLNLKVRLIILFILILLIGLTFSWSAEISHNLQAYYHHGVIYFLWVLLFMAGWAIILQMAANFRLTEYPLRYLVWIGQNVTAFYVFQWLIIGNLATVFLNSSGLPGLAGWFVAITLATTILVFVWNIAKVSYHQKQKAAIM